VSNLLLELLTTTILLPAPLLPDVPIGRSWSNYLPHTSKHAAQGFANPEQRQMGWPHYKWQSSYYYRTYKTNHPRFYYAFILKVR
jgi:hypothetical protein